MKIRVTWYVESLFSKITFRLQRAITCCHQCTLLKKKTWFVHFYQFFGLVSTDFIFWVWFRLIYSGFMVTSVLYLKQLYTIML